VFDGMPELSEKNGLVALPGRLQAALRHAELQEHPFERGMRLQEMQNE
jgi:hypothetical protein